MIAMAMTAFLLAAASAQEGIENLEVQEESFLYESADTEEVAVNEECEIIFEDENEVSEDVIPSDDEV